MIEDRDAWVEKLSDPAWRISNLYDIIVKGDDEDEGLVVRFKPNRAQRRLMARMHYRNLILKARQLGMTSLVCILWLDTALFSKEPVRCGIIAQDREAAEAIFRDKIRFAYNRLPDGIKAMCPLARETASELLFAHNGASIRVATSMRSGTIHRLHVSEFGKICAKYPDKALEVVTGSIPAVPKSGIVVIESTAEGQEGKFYDMTKRAQALHDRRAPLTPKDYRFHFFPWWEAPEYSLEDVDAVPMTPALLRYFNEVESKIGRTLTAGQRAWYAATLEADFAGEQPLMWQEYPSYPDEAFQVSTQGCYYAEQLARVRKEGRIVRGLPILPLPINTFWDLGRGDMTTVWTHQRQAMQDRFHWYYENSGEDLQHYVEKLQEWGREKKVTWGIFWLPHDAEYKRLGATPDTNKSLKEILEDLWPGARVEIVSRVTTLQAGIQATRAAFPSAWFDEEGTAAGVARLGNYRKRWNKTLGCWADDEQQDDNCHGADAFRQWGQRVADGEQFNAGATARPSGGFKRRGSPMSV